MSTKFQDLTKEKEAIKLLQENELFFATQDCKNTPCKEQFIEYVKTLNEAETIHFFNVLKEIKKQFSNGDEMRSFVSGLKDVFRVHGKNELLRKGNQNRHKNMLWPGKLLEAA